MRAVALFVQRRARRGAHSQQAWVGEAQVLEVDDGGRSRWWAAAAGSRRGGQRRRAAGGGDGMARVQRAAVLLAYIDYMKLRATCRIHAAINVTSETMDRRGWVVEIGVALHLRCDLLHPHCHAWDGQGRTVATDSGDHR